MGGGVEGVHEGGWVSGQNAYRKRLGKARVAREKVLLLMAAVMVVTLMILMVGN